MRALVFDPGAPAGLRLGDTPDPVPGPSPALVRVAATSLNFADVAFLHDRKAPGAVPGFDAAGVVAAAAGDASGRIEAFTVGDHFGPDLAYLVGLLAAGELDPQVGWRGPWHRAADAAAALIAREVRGKAVLDVSA